MTMVLNADMAKENDGTCARPSIVPVANDAPFLPISSQWLLSNGFSSAHLPQGAAIPGEINRDHLNILSAGAGSSLIHLINQPAQLVSHECTFIHERSVLSFRARLKGRSRFRVSGGDNTDDTPESYFVELTNPGSVVIAEQAVEPGEVVSFMVSEDRLRQMLDGVRVPTQIEKILNGRCDDFQLAPRISVATRRLFMALRSTPYTGGWSQLYLNAKWFELLDGVFTDLDDAAGSRLAGLDNDRAKVDIARDMLLANLGNPPTIEMLAREVGLPQRRLSEAFRAATGMTILEWLLDQKLLFACQLLAEGALSLKEISFRVGYAHRSSFAEAFARRFGVPPSQYRSSVG